MALQLLAGLAATLVYSYFFFRAFKSVLGRRQYDLRVALTGQPGVGKTVMVNVIFDSLMSGSPAFGFVAEDKTAIGVYRTLRQLSFGEWPPSTGLGTVLLYKGRAWFGRRSEVDLEVGDTAGEHWADLETEGKSAPEYLDFAISADSIIHVLSAGDLESSAEGVAASDLADIRLAANLMRGIRRSSGLLGPLLIAVSKMDLIGGAALDDQCLFQVQNLDELSRNPNFRFFSKRSQRTLTDLVTALRNDFSSVEVLLSSYEVANRLDNPMVGNIDGIAWWMLRSAKGKAGQRAGLVQSVLDVYLEPIRSLFAGRT